ncbi:MAG: tetratricopeptide repeat protein, partial [Candidatus Binataceae bacterium]
GRTRGEIVRTRWMIASAMAVTLIDYLRCLGNGFVFDDHEMIVINRYLPQWSFIWKSLVNDSWWFRDPHHLPQSSYYRPLQDIWFALNYHAFGLSPTGWHATMIVLHLAAVWLVFKIALSLTESAWTAFFTALLFGVVPVHAEAVVWPSAIPLPLSGVFELGALYLLITRIRAPRRNLATSLILYAGALLSHESAVAFPGLAAAYLFFLEERPHRDESLSPARGDEPGAVGAVNVLAAFGKRLWRTAAGTAPFAAMMAVYLLIRLAVLGFISRPNAAGHVAVAQVLLTIPAVLVRDLVLLIAPWRDGPSHRLHFVNSPASPHFYLPLIALAVVTALITLDRSKHRRLHRFCAAWMVLGVVPELNLGGIFALALVQDRYLYLPAMGWCLLVADIMVTVAHGSEARARVCVAAGGALAMLYAVVLFNVQGFWHDEVRLFTRCIQEFPDSSLWHLRLGMALEARGDLAGALNHMRISSRLDPGSGAAQFDAGQIEARLGDYKAAARDTAAGLSHIPNAPANAYVSLATFYAVAGDSAQSEAALKRAAATPGGAEDAALGRVQILLMRKDGAGAERILDDMSRHYPNDARVWYALGLARAAQANYTGALGAYRQASSIAPRSSPPYIGAAFALDKLGRGAEAIRDCRTALAVAPGNRQALAMLGRLEGARRH